MLLVDWSFDAEESFERNQSLPYLKSYLCVLEQVKYYSLTNIFRRKNPCREVNAAINIMVIPEHH